jgi:hypothetical protein
MCSATSIISVSTIQNQCILPSIYIFSAVRKRFVRGTPFGDRYVRARDMFPAALPRAFMFTIYYSLFVLEYLHPSANPHYVCVCVCVCVCVYVCIFWGCLLYYLLQLPRPYSALSGSHLFVHKVYVYCRVRLLLGLLQIIQTNRNDLLNIPLVYMYTVA